MHNTNRHGAHCDTYNIRTHRSNMRMLKLACIHYTYKYIFVYIYACMHLYYSAHACVKL